MRNSAIILILNCLILLSCQRSTGELSYRNYLKWLDDPENGTISIKKVGDKVLTCKYMPADLMAAHDVISSASTIKYDSVLAFYENQLTFILSIENVSSDESARDLMTENVYNYVEYERKVLEINFHLNDEVCLRVGNEQKKPLLAILEGGSGNGSIKSFLIVFEKQKDTMREFDLLWTDAIFLTGTHTFQFSQEVLDKVPHLKI